MNRGGSRGDIDDVTMEIDGDDENWGRGRIDKQNRERIDEHMSRWGSTTTTMETGEDNKHVSRWGSTTTTTERGGELIEEHKVPSPAQKYNQR